MHDKAKSIEKKLVHPILHLDGDAFFAACEIAKNPRLRGKPVVVGEEKGMVTALSYEAKALGVVRGMPVFQVKKMFPSVVVLPSDFDTYRRFSGRVMSIVRKYVARVQEYSIDECFADLTTSHSGARAFVEYEKLARTLKSDIERSLGITFSVGVAETKVLAKLASKREKPAGFTILTSDMVSEYLARVPIGGVWGIGRETSADLRKKGIETAGQFARLPREYIESSFHAPLIETWNELNGRAVFKVTTPEETEQRKSIQDTRSFRPATSDKNYIVAELSKHTEDVCERARAEGLVGNRISFFLKTKGGEYRRTEIHLQNFTAIPHDILPYMLRNLSAVYSTNTIYKATGVVLSNLRPATFEQNDLFGEHIKSDSRESVYSSIDTVNKRFGRGSIVLASSLGGKKDRPISMSEKLPLPYLGEVS